MTDLLESQTHLPLALPEAGAAARPDEATPIADRAEQFLIDNQRRISHAAHLMVDQKILKEAPSDDPRRATAFVALTHNDEGEPKWHARRKRTGYTIPPPQSTE